MPIVRPYSIAIAIEHGDLASGLQVFQIVAAAEQG